jgi:hypothetical protein
MVIGRKLSKVAIDRRDIPKYPRVMLFVRVPAIVYVGAIVTSILYQPLGLSALYIVIPVLASLYTVVLFENRIVNRLFRMGFPALFLFWNTSRRAYGLSLVLVNASIIFYLSPFGGFLLTRIFICMFFFLFAFSRLWIWLLPPWKEVKYCILQFLLEYNKGSPNYSWLRRAMRRVEQNMRVLGVSTSGSSLFLGLSYFLFKGISVEAYLKVLSDWFTGKADEQMARLTVIQVLNAAKRAESLGLSAPPTIRESLSRLPWNIISGIVTIASVAITAIIGLLALLHSFRLV